MVGYIGNDSDHLQNHVHLTNCIHLKNHMHMRSPVLADRHLTRDLIALPRSQSLRDRSTNPLSWHSPSAVDPLARRGKRALGGEQQREDGRLLQGSMPIATLATSQATVEEVVGEQNGVFGLNDVWRLNRGRDSIRNEERPSRKRCESDILCASGKALLNGYDLILIKDMVSGEMNHKDQKMSHKQNHGQKFPCEQLEELPRCCDDAEASHIYPHERHMPLQTSSEEAEASFPRYCGGFNRVKRHDVTGMEAAQSSTGMQDIVANNDLSVASNSFPQPSACQDLCVEEQVQEDAVREATLARKNGYEVPWNWSKIQHGGKRFLNSAGGNSYCGSSDLRCGKGKVPNTQGLRMIFNDPVASNHWRICQNSDSDDLPLLFEQSVSQESMENAACRSENLGELRIFAAHSLECGEDYNCPSKVRISNQRNSKRCGNGRHLSFTQKYMPKAFRDLVGQKLVVQALSNAVVRRKIGLIYLFYGPRGTGKTSCAHIFAKALTCQSREHPKPCGSCNSCIGDEMGKSRYVLEVGSVDNFDIESIMDLLDSMSVPQFPSQHRVLIVDDCDALPPYSWRSILKAIDIAPQHVVFILVGTSLDHLPHIIISRCQKYFFPKLKCADVVRTLQRIAMNEDLEIDKEALRLIASQSDGSLSDAEMILDQLSLIGQRISVPLVQELVGLISNEKLVDLLDLALSADTVNTVKNLREIVEAGVEPLALMSQLATVIADILAGSYEFSNERLQRKFFHRPTLSKEILDKLRQALKILSEAEKELRGSSDRLTWLTAVLLQLAPDHQYLLPSTSLDPSFSHTPMVLNYSGERDIPRKRNDKQAEMPKKKNSSRRGSFHTDHAHDVCLNNKYIGRKKHVMAQQTSASSPDIITKESVRYHGKHSKEIEDIWFQVLEKMHLNALKKFMYQEGKLLSVSFGAVPTVQLIFSSRENKSKAEKFKECILQAFASVLGSPLTIEIRCESRNEMSVHRVPQALAASESESAQIIARPDSFTNNKTSETNSRNCIRCLSKEIVGVVDSSQATFFDSCSCQNLKTEIVKIEASEKCGCSKPVESIAKLEERGPENRWLEKNASSSQQSALVPLLERRKFEEQSQNQSIVKRRVSLADIMKQAKGYTLSSVWSRPKLIFSAKNLEQDDLRLESRSRSLLCWKVSTIPGGKLQNLRIRARKPRSLLKLIPCARHLWANSPR